MAGLFGVSRITREARPVDAETGWGELIASVNAAVGVRRPVSVRLSPRVSVPLARGLRRPVVLLPSERALAHKLCRAVDFMLRDRVPSEPGLRFR